MPLVYLVLAVYFLPCTHPSEKLQVKYRSWSLLEALLDVPAGTFGPQALTFPTFIVEMPKKNECFAEIDIPL